ncbi:AraC family transcriptional regulator [Brevibacillus daliensis]|uniref:AraC family transcriptional regulator n=1 Tax=Brevibacillus daliensis TaxID=2892995 RepID=UPI001E420F2A|nr:AraC family transcriptional regulator [Brevibacillus daliensis]
MDHYNRIQHAITFIEQNLQTELTITEIASHAFFSAFHFQRLFQAISGFTVHEYIRKRRLSEAATVLKETNSSILDIAISFQYGSQEAFSRAFDSYFGISPAKYRKSDTDITKQFPLNFLDFSTSTGREIFMNKPIIMQLETNLIYGYEYKTNLNNEKHYEDIPGFYQHFGMNEYFLRISHKKRPAFSYGISTNFEDDGEFSFIVGEEVHQFAEEAESGFVQVELPAGTYAMFVVKDSVQQTRDYIYGTWLPQSKYERREGPDFEITDVCHSIFPHDMKIEIYIPVQLY